MKFPRVASVLAGVAVAAAACSSTGSTSTSEGPVSLQPATSVRSPTTLLAPITAVPRDLYRIENLTAFARLVNYVRFFHPSDEAVKANWAQFLVEYVEPVETVSDPQALAIVLQDAITSVAPSVVVYPTSDPPEVTAPNRGTASEVVAWIHRGVVTQETIDVRAPYFSERLTLPIADEHPDWFPDPAEAFVTDLGAGVSASIPLVVYMVEGRSVPRSPSPDADWLQPSLPLSSYDDYPTEDRATKQAAVIVAWGYFQHFYPYWDVVGTDWDAALVDSLRMATENPDVDLSTVLRALVAQAHDGHATVTTASQDLATPPIRWNWIEDRLVITDTRASAPSAVVTGSVVTKLGGEDPAAAIERAERLAPASTPQYRRRAALVALLEGPWGSTLDLTLIRPDGETVDAGLERTGVRVWRGGPEEPRPEPISLVAPSVGYLDLTRVRRDDLGQLPLLEPVEKLIVDLRGHPSDQAFALFARLLGAPARTDLLLVPVTTRPDGAARTYEDVTWIMEPEPPRLASEIVFLADERAQSAAETLLGMVEDNGIGEIVGSPTAGTNGNIIRFITPGGYRIAMTGMKVTDSDGNPHHGVGVQPTIEVEPTIDGIANGRDELLELAIALLSP